MPRPSARRPARKYKPKAKKMGKKAKAKKNMDTFFLRCKSLYNITPIQGTTVSNYLFKNFILFDQTLTNNAEWNLYRLQYDKFRVNSVTVKWTPKANVLDQANNNNDAAFTLTGDGLVHTAIDRDSSAPSSMAHLSRYPSYKAYSVMKIWSRTYAVKYPPNVWLDCQTPANSPQIAQSLGLNGGICLYAENLIEDIAEIFNEPVAQIEVSFNCVFQGKTSASLTFETDPETGLVTSICMTPVNPALNLVETPLVNVRGTIADTRTQSEEVEAPIDDQGNDIIVE